MIARIIFFHNKKYVDYRFAPLIHWLNYKIKIFSIQTRDAIVGEGLDHAKSESLSSLRMTPSIIIEVH